MTRAELSLSSQLQAETAYLDSVSSRRARERANPAVVATAGLRDPQTGERIGEIVGGNVRTQFISNVCLKRGDIPPATVTRGGIAGFSDVKPL